MSAFRFAPLTRALRTASLGPLMLLSPTGWALTTVNTDTTINAGTSLDNYNVVNNATLTANGASTRDITINTGSSLVLQGSQVNATGNAAGVRLSGASSSISNSQVTAEGIGLSAGVNLNDPNLTAPQADISNSIISGGSAGAQLNNAQVTLTASQLLGTNANGVGADMFDADLTASAGSSIIGGQHGVRFLGPSGLTRREGSLMLDASHVEGQNGSAIAVGTVGTAPVSARIEILNGSTVQGGNGTLVEVGATSTATIRVNASDLEGDIIAASGANTDLTLENQATLKGRLVNLERLALDSGGQWTMIEDSQLNDLAMNGGSIVFGDNGEFYNLQVANLAGNGTFVMNVDFADGTHDFLDITGTATGNHQILVASTGKDPLTDTQLHLVHAAAGNASFSLLGGPVDLGAFAYDLVQDPSGGNDWYLDASSRSLSSGSKTALALFNTASTVWYGELATLRSRMGEIRRNDGAAGVWMRSYGNQYNVSTAGFDYQQQQQGLSFGADGRLPIGDGNWLAGVSAGYSKSDLNLVGGSTGKVDSYHLGAYATWLDPHSGYYFDGVAKLNRYQNHADVQLSDGTKTKGNYDNLGLGLSLEVGRHLKLDNGYFIEPYAQLAATAIQGKAYALDNGLKVDGDVTRSLLGKLGTTAGYTFEQGQGRMIQPYLRAAVAHEFVASNRVKVNGNSFNNDLSGSRAELGAGVVVAWAQQWQAHAEFDYAKGEQLEQPWGVSLGVRYNW
jgi:outer membrane autotransporter protein